MGLFKNFMRMQVASRTYNELSRLSDHQLRDIGISRGEIRAVANRVSG